MKSKLNLVKHKKFLANLLIIPLLAFAAFAINSLNKPEAIPNIPTPDAPLAKDLNINSLGENKFSKNDSSTKEFFSTINTENNPSEPTNEKGSIQDGTVSVTELGSVDDLQFSPDRNLIVAITSNDQRPNQSNSKNPFIQKVNADSVNKKLVLLGNKGNVLVEISNDQILKAKFQDNSNIYYQTIGERGAVYQYNVKENSKKIITYTTDPEAIDNIIQIDSNNYFFVQKSTGKIGFVNTISNSEKVVDQKMMNTQSSYSQQGAYSLVGLSPDKKYITLVDMSSNNSNVNFPLKLIVLPTNASSIKEVFYSEIFPLTPRQGSLSDFIKWSSDSKYLTYGDNAKVLDIKAKKEVIKDSNSISLFDLSPDSKSIFECPFSDNNCFVRNISTHKNLNITKNISSAKWLNNSTLILTIGDRIYTYNTNRKLLESVTNSKDNYKILDVDTNKGIALVTSSGKLLQISKKN